jgi:hypothetical protein
MSLIAATLCACGGTPGKTPDNSGATLTGTPDQLLAAAITPVSSPRNLLASLPRIQAASERAPDRPELVLLTLRLCTITQRCAPETFETRLRKLDPDNAIAWLGALQRAQQSRDVAAEAQILEAMGRAKYADLYWNRLMWHSASALAEAALASNPKTTNNVLTLAIGDASTWLLAVVVPDFAPLGQACSDERMRDADTASRCGRVAQVLENGDTVIAEGVGLGIEERLSRLDPRAASSVATRVANSRYMYDTAASIAGSQVQREKFSQQQIELMKKVRREQDVFTAVLRWAGMPLTP